MPSNGNEGVGVYIFATWTSAGVSSYDACSPLTEFSGDSSLHFSVNAGRTEAVISFLLLFGRLVTDLAFSR